MSRKVKIILFLIILAVIAILKFYGNKNIKTDAQIEKTVEKYKIVKQFSEIIDETSQASENKIIVKQKEKFGIMNINGDKVKDIVYDYILRINKNVYFLQKGNEKVLCDVVSGKEIKIDEMSVINSDLYKIVCNKKYGLVDSNLNVLVEAENDFINGNNENVLIFKEKEINLYDRKIGKIKLQGNYEKIRLGIGKYFYAKKDGFWGIIDKNEIPKTEFKYVDFLELNNKNILVGYTKNKSYLINLDEDKVKETEVNYENYGVESKDRIMVLKNGKIGYIDTAGNEIIPPVYDGGFSFKDKKDFIQVKNGKIWELLTLDGKKFKELEVDDIGEYIEGYMLAEKNGKYGYINAKGNIQIPIEYDFAENFHKGFAVIAGNDGYGVIDIENNIVLPMKYDKIEIRGNHIYVVENDKYGLYSTKEEELIKPEFDFLNKIDEDLVFFRKENESGIIKLENHNIGDDKNGN